MYYLRIAHYRTCYDGLVREHYQAQLTTGNGTHAQWYRLGPAHETRRAAERELRDKAKRLSSIAETRELPAATIKTHNHIGEYGSPRRFRCDALD